MSRYTHPRSVYHEALHARAREIIAAALVAHGGNRTHAATALGLWRTHLLRLMREIGGPWPGKRRTMADVMRRGFTRRELASLLAGLRLLQQQETGEAASVHEILKAGGRRLSVSEIDRLCERLNVRAVGGDGTDDAAEASAVRASARSSTWPRRPR